MRWLAGLVLSALAGAAGADAWLDPGDALLRHDLQYLADSGVIRLPLTAWPLPSEDVARVLARVSVRDNLSPGQRAALKRLERRIGVLRQNALRTAVRLSGAVEPTRLRTFEDAPREEGEVGAQLSLAGSMVSARLKATLAVDPEDGKKWRADGSYITGRVGNWLLSAGALERWWGPGWDGSLILSTNARPVPGLSLDRESSQPFESRALKWLGPWRVSTFMGHMESERSDRDHPLLFGMRITVQPLQDLEIGLERSIQWCGEGRPCNAGAFWDAFSGHDNAGENVAAEDEPGNQLAGWSVRWASPIGRGPYALYGQHIGETIDNKIPRPLRSLELLGAEVWGEWGEAGTWRVHAEFAGTACGEFDSAPLPIFDCGYNNSIFNVEGYRYRGRPLGHSIDGDGRLYSLGLRFAAASDWSASLRLRHGELNRGGAVPDVLNTVASAPTDLWNLESTLWLPFERFEIELGAGFDRTRARGGGRGEDSARGFISWRQRL